jgi:serine/threonine-protein kinase
MGIVYKGEDLYIKRPVAIKVTLPESSLSGDQIEDYRQRFFTEAQAAGALVHPNIVGIYDAGLEGDRCYIAMEFVEGSNLSYFCAKEKLLPLDKVVRIFAKICEALDFAHQQGIIHRDIKPANVMITRNGVVKVTDFGVARFSESEFSENAGIIGSPGYMAPELLRDGKASVQSDVFSLGVTVYELLTGGQPFSGETIVDIIRKVINEEPIPVNNLIPGIPESVNQVVMGALAKSPVNRYQGAMEFLLHLRNALKEVKLIANGEKGDERIKYMKALRFFRGFREEELAQVLKIGAWFHHKKGSTIVKEDERDNNFFVVILGQVQVERQGRALALIERGSCFGEMAALSGQRRTASIVAAQDSIVIKIDAGIIDNLAKELQIKFYKQFVQSLISRLDSTSELLNS